MTNREMTIKAFRTRIISDSEEFNTVEIPVGEAKRILELLEEQEAVEFAREFMSDAVHETAKEFRQTIVRCKDCKHRPTYPKAYGAEINGKWCYWCELNRGWKHDDWFCADGERKEG